MNDKHILCLKSNRVDNLNDSTNSIIQMIPIEITVNDFINLTDEKQMLQWYSSCVDFNLTATHNQPNQLNPKFSSQQTQISNFIWFIRIG